MCITEIHVKHGKYKKKETDNEFSKKKKSKGILFSFQGISVKSYTEAMPFVLDKA